MEENIAKTKQQQEYCGSGVSKYIDLVAPGGNWLDVIWIEIYNWFLCWIPGALGMALRRLWVSVLFQGINVTSTIGKFVDIRGAKDLRVGPGSIIDDYTILDARGKVSIHADVLVGRNSIIAAKGGEITIHNGVNISSSCRVATQSSVEIGESTLIASYCYIGPGNHETDPTKPIISQGMKNAGGVKIGKHCWLGTRVTVLDGVKIGDNTIVGAHSLVTEDLPNGVIAAGVPAKVIKKREESSYKKEENE